MSKTAAECYQVRANHEWANIYVRQWSVSEADGRTRYCGEITVNSAFGVYGNSWSHCGSDFKKFLTQLEFSYFMEKTRPDYKRFDYEASMKRVREAVLEDRRHGDLSATRARSIWDELEIMEDRGGAHGFVDRLYAIEDLHHVTSEPYEYARDIPDPDSRGFWRDIWPAFIAELKAETAVVEHA